MAEVIIRKFKCDRCHAIMDQKPRHDTTYSLTGVEIGKWAGGPVIDFKELCRPCNGIIGTAIKAIAKTAEDARRNMKTLGDA